MLSVKNLPERIESKIGRSNGDCWLWLSAFTKSGYGTIWWNGKSRRAHRVIYELLVGPISEGMQLDHLCRNRSCVNPSHLEPVTNLENIRRGDAGINSKRKTHCPNGHVYDEGNIRIDGEGYRSCRVCYNMRRNRRHRIRFETDDRYRERHRKRSRESQRKLRRGRNHD